jgi:hypothetical protein
MTTRVITTAADPDLVREATATGSTTSLVLSSRAVTQRNAAQGDSTVWLARRGQDEAVWSVDSGDESSQLQSSTACAYAATGAPSASWIDQYGAAAHYAFYASVMANSNYSSVSLYA